MHNAKDLPPLNYLQAFEAAAKAESFAAASIELGISESAISRKVRLLEGFYHQPLFTRGHKSITLTADGRALYTAIKPAMQTLRDTSAKLAARHKHPTVKIAATNSVATLWLLPKLHAFKRANQHLNIMLVSSDDDAECLGDDVDLSILRGDGTWPDHTPHRLFGETIFPVCTPEFLSRHPNLQDAAALTHVPLIEVASSHAEWMNWTTWLAGHLPHVPDLTSLSIFNAYPLAIQAATQGLGVALGWSHLVDRHLKSGELIRPISGIHARTDCGYYMLERKNTPDTPGRTTVKSWLISESAARTPYAQKAG